MTEKFIGTVEAGKLLGRNPSTVIKMIKAGELKGVMFGKKWAIPYAAVLELSKTIKTSSEASRENIRKARKTIKPKSISNKVKKSPTANMPTHAAIELLLPAHTETMESVNVIRRRVGLEDWTV